MFKNRQELIFFNCNFSKNKFNMLLYNSNNTYLRKKHYFFVDIVVCISLKHCNLILYLSFWYSTEGPLHFKIVPYIHTGITESSWKLKKLG